jgi:hypothetical protein
MASDAGIDLTTEQNLFEESPSAEKARASRVSRRAREGVI